MQSNLTPAQARIVTIIRNLTALRGYSPTYREIADERGCHPQAVIKIVRRLEEKGALARADGRARTIRLIGAN